ncbi:type II toxin-antitoxin system toxin DNA ADP-ribosyl transferase DarT [Thermicanus aegyptius]|uniref:type II toxin-antitoxin system toxin DNA ADP-ribosyl transferase DarT n=1 Tax=Thermicanus aegyptius TaxID=94009 RepID=UPI00048C6377|nr:DUF4433 domain-containing protein [Thermicanus aegyptius]
MSHDYPVPTPIYHMTHIANLRKILKDQGLKAHNLIKQKNVEYVNLAHQSIQDQRATTRVPLSPNGTLHDYVPFYFAPRSPMLYSITRGNVEGYNEGQEPLIYIKSTVQIAVDRGMGWVFTDGHAIMYYSEFYNKLYELRNIDWKLMSAIYWSDTPEDNDRRRRRQAEFLVHHFFPWSAVQEIGVLNKKRQQEVQSILDHFDSKIPVHIKREWYF